MKLNRLPILTAMFAILAASCALAAPSLFTGSEERPADAVVLFDGKDVSNWVSAGSDKPAPWKVEDDYMVAGGGYICTKREFGDSQIHLEFWLPLLKDAKGQERANSGVYVQGLYEIQVLDSYGLKSGSGDCGGIYGAAPPMVNACRPPENWQSFDIFFHAAKFDADGKKTASARMSVVHNGVWIHENVEVPGPTLASLERDPKLPGPLMLQDHGSPVRYRNVWIRPIGEAK